MRLFCVLGAVKDRTVRPHLNIDFTSVLPADAKGIFAELSGLQKMSNATRALLKQPSSSNSTNATSRSKQLLQRPTAGVADAAR